ILSRPSPWIASTPPLAHTAPTSPPISAWVELDGMRKYHETSIQTTVAVSAAPIVDGNTTLCSTISSPTAPATATPNKNGPINCATVDRSSALHGPIAREAISVATLLGAPHTPVSAS